MSNISTLILLACLATGVPRNVCLAEVDFDNGCTATNPWEDLSWVKPEWPLYAAHVVASESRGVDSADIVIACTMIWDIVEGGRKPFELHLHGRWNGWGTPDELDEEAVYRALLTDACAKMPRYQFVGNLADAKYWRSIGMIHEGPFDLYMGTAGQAVVGVPSKSQ